MGKEDEHEIQLGNFLAKMAHHGNFHESITRTCLLVANLGESEKKKQSLVWFGDFNLTSTVDQRAGKEDCQQDSPRLKVSRREIGKMHSRRSSCIHYRPCQSLRSQIQSSNQ